MNVSTSIRRLEPTGILEKLRAVRVRASTRGPFDDLNTKRQNAVLALDVNLISVGGAHFYAISPIVYLFTLLVGCVQLEQNAETRGSKAISSDTCLEIAKHSLGIK